MNPYESPSSTLNSPKFPRRKVATLVVAVIGMGLLVVSGYHYYAAARLKVDYPGLSDPSPEVDAYWPSVAHLIYTTCGTLLGIAGVVCGVITIALIYSAASTRDKAQ